MQRDRRKRYSPARHPVLLRRVLLVLTLATLTFGVGYMAWHLWIANST